MTMHMSRASLYFDRTEDAALITPDALRIRFRLSGFPIAELRQTEDGPNLQLGDKLELWLSEESGFITEIAMDVTFVDTSGDRRVRRAAELLESMGWICEESMD